MRGIRSTVLRESVKAGATVIRPPHVQTVDAWLEDAWRRQVESGALPAGRLLDRIAERALWQQIIESDLKEQGDFTLLQVPRAAEQASRARRNGFFTVVSPATQPRERPLAWRPTARRFMAGAGNSIVGLSGMDG